LKPAESSTPNLHCVHDKEPASDLRSVFAELVHRKKITCRPKSMRNVQHNKQAKMHKAVSQLIFKMFKKTIIKS
jgi:hypothetical protein